MRPCLYLCGIVFLLFAAVVPAQVKNPMAPDQHCGPPNYCARTDRKVEGYPKTSPALGPAGSVLTDPNFGSRILRVTDGKSDPMGKGRSIMTPSSAEQNSWNSTSSRFYVLTPSNQPVLYDFDPLTLQARQRTLLKLSWQGEPQFSYTDPDVLYGTSREKPEIQQYDISKDKITSLDDASQCLKLRPEDLGHSITVSADGDRMSTGIGPQQNKNYLLYVYDRHLGCRWYNTETGEIGGKWGPKGTISVPDRFSIHNSRLSKSGKFVYIARGKSTVGRFWVVWELETMNVTPCPMQCTGHRAMGYSHMVDPSGQHHPLDLMLRPLNHLDSATHLISDLTPLEGAEFWYDQHFSWNNVDPADSAPVCLSTYNVHNPDSPGTPLNTASPWENEILCVETDGKASKVWRFAHTFSTARNGFWSSPRGNVSPDGRFFMFTSDWQDQLGEAPNSKEGKYRTDVFIVELR